MDKSLQDKLTEIKRALAEGKDTAALVGGRVRAIELVSTHRNPTRVICEDGTPARCEIAYDSKGKQYCIWHCD